MLYPIIVLGLIAVLMVLVFFHHQNTLKKQTAKLKAFWGKPKEEYINFNKVRRYTNLSHLSQHHELSEQTMNDIDFDRLFTFLDRTTSKIGQQYLYDRLRKPLFSKQELQQFDTQCNFFSSNLEARITAQLELGKLGSEQNYSVVSLLNKNLPEAPRWFSWLYVDLSILVASFILSFKWPLFIILGILTAAFNVFYLNYLNKKNVLQFNNSLPQLDLLIRCAKGMSKMNLPFDRGQIQESTSVFKYLQRLINVIYFGYELKGQENLAYAPLYLFDIIKSILLVESFTLYGLLNSIKKNQDKIQTLFSYVGLIDCAVATASLRSGSLETCVPVFTAEKKFLHIEEGIHPLIDNCVGNSIEIRQKSVLLTGSNMSGKSTFLRMLSINALLSQTLYTCFAKKYTASMMSLYSSVRIDDNLFQGKSYFFQEVNVMSTLIDAVDREGQNLYILDEIFKGTNTIERIASAKALLSFLDQKDHIIFVSTHDIELINLLEAEYELYHFTETVKDEKLYFDHMIKPGPLKSRNAIKILELMHFPDKIIREANELSKIMLERSDKNDFMNSINASKY